MNKNRSAVANALQKAMTCLTSLVIAGAFVCLSVLSLPLAEAQSPGAGLGKAVVHTALGGFILGYDVDSTGTEGLLSEALNAAGGKFDVAIETFDQKTGKILKIVDEEKNTNNDFVTFGIFGSSVGLVEEELSKGIYVDKRVYGTLNPLNGNKVTGQWTPPFTKNDIVISVPFSQGSQSTPVLYFDNSGNNFNSYIIDTSVAANTFGKPITISAPPFSWSVSPVIAYDSQTNQAVLGGSLGCFGCTTEIGLVDLTTGGLDEFEGLGFGFINGIAVDPNTGIACTATEDDFSVEFYNLANQTGFIVPLQGATNQANSGGAVAVDPIHKLFLIGQEFSSVGVGSSIQVYDEQGNFIEAVNGLKLPASSAYMALHPSQRAGYVIVTPDLTELQSFTY